MLPSLDTLIRRPDLALRPIGTAEPAALAQSVEWVHSSDLADPTPFLGDGTVLLTTGTWLGADDDEATADAYVARLVARGLVGLGFGTEVVRAGTPVALISACARHGLPLFEVPYRTPFIAVVRASADLIAADAYARHSWALEAQRAISLAALRPDGLRAALAELSRELGSGVALFDAGGTLDMAFPADAIDTATVGDVQRDVVQLIARGQRASRPSGDGSLVLHTLGRRGRLRGVLAVGGVDGLDRQAREVVAAVVGLASLALEQNAEVDRATERLRASVMQAVLAGDRDLALRVAEPLWDLPAGRVRIAALDLAELGPGEVAAALTSRERAQPGELYFAISGERATVIVAEGSLDVLDQLARALDTRIGVSEPVETNASANLLTSARDQAVRALTSAPDPGIAAFGTVAEIGILATLGGTELRTIADAILAPVRAHDLANSAELVPTLRAWLENDAQFDRAAVSLGVHRHTVRARVATAERLLERDLSRFPVRAELWAALLASP